MPRFVPSAFARRLLGQMRRDRAATGDGSVHPLYPDWTTGLYPGFRDAVGEVLAEDKVELHTAIRALNSSMAFALNLFLPFRTGASHGLAGVLQRAGLGEMHVDGVAFEYVGSGDVLAEAAGRVPTEGEKFTSADAAVLVRSGDRTGVVLVEVKLTEETFSHCGGAASNGNKRRDVCSSSELFFSDPTACYLTRPARAHRDRRYWTILAEAHGSVRAAFPAVHGGHCPFRRDRQQPMRNHALALGLVQAGIVDFAAFGLVHHDDNPDIPPLWDEYASVVADPGALFRLPAGELLDAATARDPALVDWARWMRTRYRIGGVSNEL